MENLPFFRRIFTAIIFTFYVAGCSSSDDSEPNNSANERTKIIMEIPDGDEEIDWDNAELVWNQEFEGSSLVGDLWNFETNPDDLSVADQLQIFSKKNVKIDNGTLKIFAIKVGEGQNKGDYTSGRINGKYAFQYGRIEVNAKLPAAEKNGLWAQIGLVGNNLDTVNWPRCGEIDIMEYFSYMPNETFINLHSDANNANDGTYISASAAVETAEEEFHVYGILWTDKYLKFYIDDLNNIIYTFNQPAVSNQGNWPFDQPFYPFMHLVVGGRFADPEGVDDSMFPATMEIDYIRVYHPK